MARFESFRPAYTRVLASRLVKGEAILLIGDDGQGASRLVEDLTVILTQAHYVDASDSPDEIVSSLGDPEIKTWQDKLAEWQHLEAPVCLILNHARISCFGSNQEEALSVVRQMIDLPRLSFLLLSPQPLPELDELLGLVREKLPPLGYKRLKEEILRSNPDEKDWNSIASPVYSHSMPYKLLQYVLEQRRQHPEWQDISPKEWMPGLVTEFNKSQGIANRHPSNGKNGFWKRLKGK